MDLMIPLKKKITVHGHDIEELTFGEPTGELVVQLGEPYFHMSGGGFRELPEVTVNYIVKLCKIPRSSALALAPGDRKAFFAKLLPFLLPNQGMEEDLDD
ncbi:hypothetical protein [Pseudomonas anguilliseptica]|uniref:hypothetical protein n=1 Tax=Pseudomonas anguilliseptica TaxID=53406 RepID=UPI00325B2633